MCFSTAGMGMPGRMYRDLDIDHVTTERPTTHDRGHDIVLSAACARGAKLSVYNVPHLGDENVDERARRCRHGSLRNVLRAPPLWA